jgi:uncharacterized protein (TIGR03435 family)
MNPILLSALANHLWQSTIVTALAALVVLLLRRYGAHIRYWVWFAASIKFLVPFSLLISLGSEVQLRWRVAPTSVAPTSLSLAVTDVAQPFTLPITSALNEREVPPARLAQLQTIFVIVWLGGFLLIVTMWRRNWLRMRAIMRGAAPLALPSNIKALTSPVLLEPSVFGAFRPVLILPEGIEEQLSKEQFQSVLAHEICHVRRRDNLLSSLHMTAAAIFWFYPVVWWLGARLLDERERACDEQVIRQGYAPRAYAEGILGVCQFYLRTPVRYASGVSGGNLQHRIEAIISGSIGRTLGFKAVCLLFGAAMTMVAAPIVLGLVSSSTYQNEPPGDTATFEVTSVRLNKSGLPTMNLGRPFKGRTYSAKNAPIRNIIGLAYGIPPARVAGGPSWLGAPSTDMRFIGGDRFDITATLPSGDDPDQIPSMLRKLLRDRFNLVVHRENRDSPVYALVVDRADGRLGPRLRKVSFDCEAAQAAGTLIPAPKPGERSPCEREVGGEIVGRGQRLSELARMVSLFTDRPVIDRTSLNGGFDFDLKFPELETSIDATGPRTDPASFIFTAVQVQLGLKLESTRGVLEFIVVDRVEHPTEN